MNWTPIIALFVLFILLTLIKRLKRLPSKQGQSDYRYRKLGKLFTPAERSFLGVLNQSVGSQAQVFGKVRVADVLAPAKGYSASHRQSAFNKISAKHFDFVLCDPQDLSVLCVIELDDASHQSQKRQIRDAFLQSACQSAKLSLIQIPAQASYNIHEIRQSLLPYLPVTPATPESTTPESTTPELTMFKPPAIAIEKSQPQTSSYQKSCPQCSSPLQVKTAKKGQHAGNDFWACSTFPQCWYKEDMNH